MKTLIIYKSVHNMCTEKLAKRMAGELSAAISQPIEAMIKKINQYDLVGFGSGIYDAMHHPALLDLADKLPDLKRKRVFLFSTAGVISKHFHDRLKEKLVQKNATMVDDFYCKGFNTNSFLKYFGGMNKGRPNEDDLNRAAQFARRMRV